MTTLTFNSNKTLKSLARETLDSKEFHLPYSKETTNKRGVFLVKDQGIYLMDAFCLEDEEFKVKDEPFYVVYASGYNPKYDKHNDLCSRAYEISSDDFGEFIPLDEDALYRILKGGSVKVRITDHHLEVKA